MDKFLADFGGISFKDLLEKQDEAAAEPASPVLQSSAGPSFLPPASKARPSTAPPAKKARHAAEPSSSSMAVPSSADEAAAPVPSAAEVQVSPAEAAEIAQAKAKALRLYRAAQDSCRQAAKADGERSGDPKISEICSNVAEAQFASEFDIRWQDRGPRGSDAPSSWRGQSWRESSGRYGNRGGNPEKNKWYAEQARLKAKGKGKSKDEQKGKGKHKASKAKGENKGKDTGTNKGTGTSSPSSGPDTGI